MARPIPVPPPVMMIVRVSLASMVDDPPDYRSQSSSSPSSTGRESQGLKLLDDAAGSSEPLARSRCGGRFFATMAAALGGMAIVGTAATAARTGSGGNGGGGTLSGTGGGTTMPPGAMPGMALAAGYPCGGWPAYIGCIGTGCCGATDR